MSDRPVITPTASILRDDKAILVFVGLIVETLIHAVPALEPYSSLLTLVVFLGFGLLVLHQSIEDLIYAWADARATVTVTSSSVSGTAGSSEARTIETVKPGVPPVGSVAGYVPVPGFENPGDLLPGVSVDETGRVTIAQDIQPG